MTTNMSETPAEEFHRLVVAHNEPDSDSAKEEAWNQIADFALEHADTIVKALSPSRLSANDEGVTDGYDAQALKGAAEFFEGMATGSDPAPLAFAHAIRRVLSALSTKPEGVKRDFEEAASYLKRIAEEVPRGHESVARGRSTYNWLTHCANLLRTQPPSPAPESGEPVAYMAFDQNGCCELFIEEENAIEFASDGGSVGPLGILPSSNTDRHEHSYAEGWKQGLKEAEQIAVEMRKVHGSSTGDAYRCGAWDQGVRIAAAIRNTADSRNVAAPTPASGEQMEVVGWLHVPTGNVVSSIGRDQVMEKVHEQMGDVSGDFIPLVALAAANERAERAASHWKLAEEQVAEQMVALNAAEALNTTLSEALERLENDGKEFLEAAEAVFDWMNGNDLSADHEEQKPDDFKRVSEALVAFRTALAALPAKQGGQS